MLREQPVVNTLLINLLLGAIWHYITFFLCISVSTAVFDSSRKMYRPHKWENNGKIYNDIFKINKWKDSLPQHIGKDGFSKDHIDDISLEYIDEFIMETCRGEWNHTMNCMFSLVLFFINNLLTAVIFTVLLLAGNIPFVIIQRYNRFRLQKLRKTIVRKANRQNKLLAGEEKNTQDRLIGEVTEHETDSTVNQI